MSHSHHPILQTRKDRVFLLLAGFFLTNAIVAELIGGKLFAMPPIDLGWLKFNSVVLSVGVIPWPVVFLSTDIINEYFGKPAVRMLTFLAVGMILYSFLILFLAMGVPTWEKSPITHEMFAGVFGQGMWIIAGSIAAFMTSQFVDVMVFWFFRNRTGGKMLWLRATGSTVVSQIIDTFLVGFIAFVIPGKLAFADFVPLAVGSYLYKLGIAILITPLIYVVHNAVDRYLAGDKPAA